MVKKLKLTGQFEKDFNTYWSKEARRLKNEGYSSGLVDKARNVALHYIYGIVNNFFNELPLDKRKELYDYMINDALNVAERWVKGLTEVLGNVKSSQKMSEALFTG